MATELEFKNQSRIVIKTNKNYISIERRTGMTNGIPVLTLEKAEVNGLIEYLKNALLLSLSAGAIEDVIFEAEPVRVEVTDTRDSTILDVRYCTRRVR
jgi:hypothetical protein